MEHRSTEEILNAIVKQRKFQGGWSREELQQYIELHETLNKKEGDTSDEVSDVFRKIFVKKHLLSCDRIDHETRHKIEGDIDRLCAQLQSIVGSSESDVKDLKLFSDKLNRSISEELSEILPNLGKLDDGERDKDLEQLSAESEVRRVTVVKEMVRSLQSFARELFTSISEYCSSLLGKSSIAFAHILESQIDEACKRNTVVGSLFVVVEFPSTIQKEAMTFARLYLIVYDVLLVLAGEPLRRLLAACNMRHQLLMGIQQAYMYTFTREKKGLINTVSMLSKRAIESNHTFHLVRESSEIYENLKKSLEREQGDIGMQRRLAVKNLEHEIGENKVNLKLEYIGSRQRIWIFIHTALRCFLEPLLLDFCRPVFKTEDELYLAESFIESTGNSLPTEAQQTLRYACALVDEIRMKLSLFGSVSSENLYGTVLATDTTGCEKIKMIFDVIGKQGAVDLYEIALLIRTGIQNIVNEGTSDKLDLQMVKHLGNCLSKRGDLKLRGDILRHFQDFEAAMRCYTKALKISVDFTTSGRKKRGESLQALGLCCLHTLHFREAESYYCEAADIEKTLLTEGQTDKLSLVHCLNMHGQCLTEMGKSTESLKVLSESLKKCDEILKEDPTRESCEQEYADVLDSLAWYHFKSGDYSTSLDYYNKSIKSYSSYYGSGAINHDMIKVLNGTAMCYLKLERFDEALTATTKIIKMKNTLIGEKVADLNVAQYYRRKGDCLKEMGRLDQSQEAYKTSIQIRDKCVGSEAEKNCSQANTIARLADCYLKAGRHGEAADQALTGFRTAREAEMHSGGRRFMMDAKNVMVQVLIDSLDSSSETSDDRSKILKSAREMKNLLENSKFRKVHQYDYSDLSAGIEKWSI